MFRCAGEKHAFFVSPLVIVGEPPVCIECPLVSGFTGWNTLHFPRWLLVTNDIKLWWISHCVPNTIIQLYNYTIIQLYNYTIIQLYNYTIIQLYNHTIIQLYNYTIIQLYNYTIIQLYNYTIIQLYNYTIIQLYNYTIIQLYNYTIIQLYNYTIIQLYNYTIIQLYIHTYIHTYIYIYIYIWFVVCFFSPIYWEESSQPTFIFFKMAKTTNQQIIYRLYPISPTIASYFIQRPSVISFSFFFWVKDA